MLHINSSLNQYELQKSGDMFGIYSFFVNIYFQENEFLLIVTYHEELFDKFKFPNMQCLLKMQVDYLAYLNYLSNCLFRLNIVNAKSIWSQNW